MRPFVWHPWTNPFPKTKVDRFNRQKTISKNVGHSTCILQRALGPSEGLWDVARKQDTKPSHEQNRLVHRKLHPILGKTTLFNPPNPVSSCPEQPLRYIRLARPNQGTPGCPDRQGIQRKSFLTKRCLLTVTNKLNSDEMKLEVRAIQQISS